MGGPETDSGSGMKTAADPETRITDNENEIFAQAGTPLLRKKGGFVRFGLRHEFLRSLDAGVPCSPGDCFHTNLLNCERILQK
jgi:hypothetical protein